ncbi:hypothetical protein [Streptomyces sp. NPDC001530]|uniref:hypothetical protein n=1 Tax=Streptomyces sp. NPDC001530 TaxID=3364582 RepID=UPI0036AD498C
MPITAERGAPPPFAGLTALRAPRLGGNLLGRRVLISGADGGVGRFQVELAAAAGAIVTAVAQQDEDLLVLGAYTSCPPGSAYRSTWWSSRSAAPRPCAGPPP